MHELVLVNPTATSLELVACQLIVAIYMVVCTLCAFGIHACIPRDATLSVCLVAVLRATLHLVTKVLTVYFIMLSILKGSPSVLVRTKNLHRK